MNTVPVNRASQMDFKVGGGGVRDGGYGTLESVVGHHGWLTRNIFERSRMVKKIIL